MKLKTIFITIPWFLPAYKAGGPVQSIASLGTVFNENIEYRIFCSNSDLGNIALPNIETNKWVQHNHRTKVWYATPGKIKKDLLHQVNTLKPDVLFIIGLFSWHFNIVPLLFCKVPKKIISVRGMLHPGALKQKKIKKKLFLYLFKTLKFRNDTCFHATDEVEKKYIQQIIGMRAKIYTAGNFPRTVAAQKGIIKTKGNIDLISIAIISPMKNILLVLKALEQCSSNINYHIFGPIKDVQYWKHCLEQIKNLPSNIKVDFNGSLPPNQVEEKLNQAHVFILPSESENFGHAIYEALSAGKPVITTDNTPWKELKYNQAGVNVTTSIDSIKNAIEFFAQMPQLVYDEWSDSAIDYATAKLDLPVLKNQYKEMFGS